jgi:transcriptional regulator with XRE-family HTH domain
MPRELAKPPPKSRYSYKAATTEIEKEISAGERGTQKDVASYLNLTEQQFSHRMRGVNAKFTVEHFGAIADFFKAPAGWPFVPMTDEERAARARKGKR